MGYKVIGRYRNNDYEEIDSAETKDEADFLRDEYRLAFGSEWLIKVVRD